MVPPTPHPYPYEYIALLATQHGLLLRQFFRDGARPESQIRISWGKDVRVEEISIDAQQDEPEWNESVVVYGLIGILNLLNGAYQSTSPLSGADPIL
jgi:phosphatidylinositol 4-phosphatase